MGLTAWSCLQTSPVRYVWNHAHHWTGRLAVILAIINVYLGLKLAEVSVLAFFLNSPSNSSHRRSIASGEINCFRVGMHVS